MKTAYELALERMEQRGIERPREDAVTDATRDQIAELRSKAAAELAQLEIMHRKELAADPTRQQELEERYVAERRRIEERRDHKIEQLRSAGS